VFHTQENLPPENILRFLHQLAFPIAGAEICLISFQDGVVTDLQETKDALVKASDLPLSILIVGVGGADFKEMEVYRLDNMWHFTHKITIVDASSCVWYITAELYVVLFNVTDFRCGQRREA